MGKEIDFQEVSEGGRSHVRFWVFDFESNIKINLSTILFEPTFL